MRALFLAALLAGCTSRLDSIPPDAEAPPAHDAGADIAFSLTFAPGPIAPGAEGTHCIDIPTPPVEHVVSGWRVRKQGVHHVNLYKRKDPAYAWHTLKAPCVGGYGVGWFLFDDSRAAGLEQHFGNRGVVRFPPSTLLVFDAHYFNPTTAPIDERVTVDFFAAADPSLPELHGINWLPPAGVPPIQPGERRSVTAEIPPGSVLQDVEVLSLIGHQHAHGVGQTVTVDGVEVYRSASWSDPPVVYPETLTLNEHSRIRWTCEIYNTSASPLAWAQSDVNKAEMCNVFGLASWRWERNGVLIE